MQGITHWLLKGPVCSCGSLGFYSLFASIPTQHRLRAGPTWLHFTLILALPFNSFLLFMQKIKVWKAGVAMVVTPLQACSGFEPCTEKKVLASKKPEEEGERNK